MSVQQAWSVIEGWLGKHQPGMLRLLHGPADLRMRIGHCNFGSPDAALLVSLLPQVVLARGESRLVTLMQLVGEETRAQRPARDLVLERLLEVLLIEALRCGTETVSGPSLARGLADPDPWRGFRFAVSRLCELQAYDLGFTAAFKSAFPQAVDFARLRTESGSASRRDRQARGTPSPDWCGSTKRTCACSCHRRIRPGLSQRRHVQVRSHHYHR